MRKTINLFKGISDYYAFFFFTFIFMCELCIMFRDT